MAIAFVSSAATVDSSGTATRTITKPTGLVAGNVCVLVCSGNLSGPGTVTSAPSGFTFLRRVLNGSNSYLDIYWKVLTSSEPTWSITYSGSSKGCYHAVQYSGVDTTTPFDAESGAADTASGTSHTSPSITTTGAGRWLISTFSYRLTSGAAWSGLADTSRYSSVTGGTNSVQHTTQDTNGTVTAGSYSRSGTSSSTSTTVMWIGALNPAASGVSGDVTGATTGAGSVSGQRADTGTVTATATGASTCATRPTTSF